MSPRDGDDDVSLLVSKTRHVSEDETPAAYGPGVGHPQGAPSVCVTEFTTYRPCIQAELVDLGKQFLQQQGEHLAACHRGGWYYLHQR